VTAAGVRRPAGAAVVFAAGVVVITGRGARDSVHADGRGAG
jgi:hypothetical protein